MKCQPETLSESIVGTSNTYSRRFQTEIPNKLSPLAVPFLSICTEEILTKKQFPKVLFQICKQFYHRSGNPEMIKKWTVDSHLEELERMETINDREVDEVLCQKYDVVTDWKGNGEREKR
jgi:hypothetical protein